MCVVFGGFLSYIGELAGKTVLAFVRSESEHGVHGEIHHGKRSSGWSANVRVHG